MNIHDAQGGGQKNYGYQDCEQHVFTNAFTTKASSIQLGKGCQRRDYPQFHYAAAIQKDGTEYYREEQPLGVSRQLQRGQTYTGNE